MNLEDVLRLESSQTGQLDSVLTPPAILVSRLKLKSGTQEHHMKRPFGKNCQTVSESRS